MEQRTTRGRIVVNLFGERLVYGRIREENMDTAVEAIAENLMEMSIEGWLEKIFSIK